MACRTPRGTKQGGDKEHSTTELACQPADLQETQVAPGHSTPGQARYAWFAAPDFIRRCSLELSNCCVPSKKYATLVSI
eukprot:137315-Amphidinium_carterae.1